MKTMVSCVVAVLLFGQSVAGSAFAATAVTSPAGPANAAPYTCERQALSRIAHHPEAHPASCCTGLFGCPQLLANTGLIKPRRLNRT